MITRSVASGGGGALPPTEEGGGPLLFDEGLDREYFDLTTASTEEASAAIFRATTPPSAHHQVHCGGGGNASGGDGVPSYSNATDCPLAAFDIVNLGDDEFGFRLPDNTVVDSTGNQSHKGDSSQFKNVIWNRIAQELRCCSWAAIVGFHISAFIIEDSHSSSAVAAIKPRIAIPS